MRSKCPFEKPFTVIKQIRGIGHANKNGRDLQSSRLARFRIPNALQIGSGSRAACLLCDFHNFPEDFWICDRDFAQLLPVQLHVRAQQTVNEYGI